MEKANVPDNLGIYNCVRKVPQEAQKPIEGGRLKGKTDINPMWRIKALTEQFGPVGIGWKYEVLKMWTEQSEENTIAAFANINLYIKYNNEWSEAIFGTGGSIFKELQKGSPYTNDECYKMALTDALSVSCKALGMAADVYWDKDNTKYSDDKKRDKPGNNDRPEHPQTNNKKASEKQITLIDSILSEISRGYAAIGKKVAVDATIQQMKTTLDVDKELTEFSIADAGKAIDYLTNLKINIPKPNKTA
jgi:hypothetical protein